MQFFAKKIWLYGLFFVVILPSKAQNINNSVFREGKMVFQIEYQDSLLNQNPIHDAAFSKEMVFLIKGSKFRTEIQSSFTQSSNLGNLETRKNTTYISFLDKKFQIRFNLDTLKEEAFSRNPFTFQKTHEKKDILGFHCEKIILHFTNPNVVDATAYCTTDILNYPSPFTYGFSTLPGMILELNLDFQGIPLHIFAKQIQKISISDEYFLPLVGFKPAGVDDFIKKALEN